MEKVGIDLKDSLLYDSLKAQIRYHKYMYYELALPSLTDYEYDILEKQFDKLAERLGREGSWVGYNAKK